MIQWEYKNIYGSLHLDDNTLNEIGSEGWELITIMFRYESGPKLNYYNYYFKRPLKQQP